jgi:hypothetical protein
VDAEAERVLIRGALVLVFRAVFGLGTMLIVLAAVLDAWDAGQPLLAVVAFVATPLTFFLYPWLSGDLLLRVVWSVSLVAFIAGNGLAGVGRSGSSR